MASPRVLVVPLVASLLAAGLGAGCRKRPPTYKQGTPEEAVAALFVALEAGRLPEDLPELILDGVEAGRWHFRCEEQGCRSGQFTQRGTTTIDGDRATLVIDYEIRGDDDRLVGGGTATPVEVQRVGDRWIVDHIGVQVRIRADGTVIGQDAGAGAGPADGGDADHGSGDAGSAPAAPTAGPGPGTK